MSVWKYCQLFTHESNTFLGEQYVIPPIQINGGALSLVFNRMCPSHNASALGGYMHSLSAFYYVLSENILTVMVGDGLNSITICATLNKMPLKCLEGINETNSRVAASTVWSSVAFG